SSHRYMNFLNSTGGREMIRFRSALGILLMLVAVSPAVFAAASDPYAPTITLTVTPPNGKAQTSEVRESDTAIVKLDNGTEYKFRVTLVDAKPWNQVVVAIFKGATSSSPDQSLGEVQVKTGAPAVTSKTNPAFKIAVPKVTAPTQGPTANPIK